MSTNMDTFLQQLIEQQLDLSLKGSSDSQPQRSFMYLDHTTIQLILSYFLMQSGNSHSSSDESDAIAMFQKYTEEQKNQIEIITKKLEELVNNGA
ncbi:hypothetical protein ACFOZ1_10855 [Gracilibacillus marinus]|jgi:hypothetical protein|uniref:Uncharacterized protein n=1 Tax=Gracilibacillus marinus TaxID=630535 RepID=A0ABV8VZ28_9BACI